MHTFLSTTIPFLFRQIAYVCIHFYVNICHLKHLMWWHVDVVFGYDIAIAVAYLEIYFSVRVQACISVYSIWLADWFLYQVWLPV